MTTSTPLKRDQYSRALVLANTTDMPREEWLQYRQRSIGGSEISSILGISPFRSAIELWLEKTGRKDPDYVPSEAAQWGLKLEPAVADWFKEQHPEFHVIRRNAILQHPDVPYATANVDRLIRVGDGDWQLLEIKTASAYKADAWDDGAVPVEYQAQVQWYLGILGYRSAWVSVLIGGNRYEEREITANENVFAMMLEGAERFWHDYVLADVMPPADGSRACTELLAELYPESETGTSVELPPTFATKLELLADIKAQIKKLETDATTIENEVKREMGPAESAFVGDWTVTWKNTEARRVDTKRLKTEAPDIYERFSTVSSSRRFLVKGGK